MFYILVWGEFVVMKYIAIWILAEGPCVLSGLGFDGYQNGVARWGAVSNIDTFRFFVSPNFVGLISTWNINTNKWIKNYIFKRFKHLGNKEISFLISLTFLAIWHGWYLGYFVSFYSELIYLRAEQHVQRIHAPLVEYLNQKRNFFFCPL